MGKQVAPVIKLLVGMLALGSAAAAAAATLAISPPMGWNSWDGYGFTITEDQFKANAKVLASLKAWGWDTAVIDEGWYMANPLGANLAERAYHYDPNGRLTPDPVRFPSAGDGEGLKALAQWTHAQGLKFGIHIVRGIPKAAVDANLPIAGSSFSAREAADRSALCPWDDANYGVADNAAGQSWYNSLMQQYAGWGVDFIKVDCIADHPYRPTEIRQISEAIRQSGRAMVLSLSPGPTSLSHAAEVRQYAQMWRIMDDLWDGWTFPHSDPKSEFPNGIRNAFDRLSAWAPFAAPGSWPDADMLPFGSLRPHPGWGDPRQSRLTQTETRTALTLWATARSPLILGGNLTEAPPFLEDLLKARQVIALDQEDRISHPLDRLPGFSGDLRVWISGRRGSNPDTLAIFNVSDLPIKTDVAWTEFGFPSGPLEARDLWTGAHFVRSRRAALALAPHDVLLLRVCGRDTACH